MIRLKALLTILVVGSGIFVGSKVVPEYYAYYRFQNDLENVTMAAAYSSKSETEIQDSIVARGRDYGIPLTLEQIRVRRIGSEISISVEYTVHLDIPIYPFDLKFAPMAKYRRL